jgi:hypothetical protein
MSWITKLMDTCRGGSNRTADPVMPEPTLSHPNEVHRTDLREEVPFTRQQARDCLHEMDQLLLAGCKNSYARTDAKKKARMSAQRNSANFQN